MGHSVRAMIEMCFTSFVFLAAVTVGLLLFQSSAAALNSTYVSSQSADRSIHSTLSPIAGDGTVSGAEVFQSIAHISDIGVELVVDGTVYAAQTAREDAYLSEIRVSGRYVVSYQRGPHGELQRVIYTLL